MNNPKRINEFKVGGNHAGSPYGGIPFEKNVRVQEGETSINFPGTGNYIFSNDLYINDSKSKIPISLPEDLTFAEASSFIEKKYEEGGNKIEADTKREALTALRDAQEQLRAEKSIPDPLGRFEMGGDTADSLLSLGQTASNIASSIPIPGVQIAGGVASGILGLIQKKRNETKVRENDQNIERGNVKAALAIEDYKEPTAAVYKKGGYGKMYPEGGYGGLDTSLFERSYNQRLNNAPLNTAGFEQSYANAPLNTSGFEQSYSDRINKLNPIDDSAPLDTSGFEKSYAGATADPKKGIGSQMTKLEKLGLLGQYASSTVGNIAGLIGSNRNRAPKSPRYDLGPDRNPNKVDLSEIRRSIIRNEQSNRYGLAQRSGGDFGQYAQNVSQLHAGSAASLGKSYTEAEKINLQENQFTSQYNLRKNQLANKNAMFADDLDLANTARGEDQSSAYRDALFANASSLGKSLQNVEQGDREIHSASLLALAKELDMTPEELKSQIKR
jgi:hypothetical protein